MNILSIFIILGFINFFVISNMCGKPDYPSTTKNPVGSWFVGTCMFTAVVKLLEYAINNI